MLTARRFVYGLLVVALCNVAAVAAQDDDESTDGAVERTTGQLRWDEEVEVRVVLDETAEAQLGASSTVIEPNDEPTQPRALADIVVAVPGVSENGQGGLFQGYSIRGVSRQRVMSMISGMRITSERRAGVSTSFLDPTLMGSVEVLRGPSTTFYGSGALGGVVEISPAEFSGWSVAAGYESNGDENYQSFGYGADEWSAGFAMRRAGEGEAADGDPLNTGFTQYSGVFRWNRKAKGKRYEIMFLPSYGQDIGKSNTDFPERTTTYPRERHGLLRFSIDSDRDWRFLSFVHAQDLRTEVAEDELQSDIFTEAVDLGLRWEGKRGAGSAELRYGADLFARRNVNAREVRQDFSDDSVVTQESLDDAQGTELGAFASSHWDRGKTKWEIGGRYSHIEQENGGAPERKRNAASGYGGVSRELGDSFEVRGGISSGLRFPSLSEQFFSGTTGRGEVIGNPRLDDERSLNLEASLRWIGKSVVIKGDLFRNEISDYIERIEIAPDVLTFVNLTSGTIRGAELQGVAHLGKPWNLSFGGHLIEGESDDGNPLADIPPDELYIGGTRRSGRITFDGRLTLRDRIDDPGSGEKPIPSAQLLAIAVTYRWAESWSWTVGGANLLDEDYFLSADSKAALAAGRTFYVQIRRRL